MDIVADLLKELQEADIPVLFRPYHEMNGFWFWWGGRPGEEGSMALWRKLFEYYTKHHKLNNLIWVWSPDKPWFGLEKYYPGDDYVDIVGCDIYPEKDTSLVFRPEWYSEIKVLAGNKPLIIGECSILPTVSELKEQTKWVSFMNWSYSHKINNPDSLRAFYNHERVITLDELPWNKIPE